MTQLVPAAGSRVAILGSLLAGSFAGGHWAYGPRALEAAARTVEAAVAAGCGRQSPRCPDAEARPCQCECAAAACPATGERGCVVEDEEEPGVIYLVRSGTALIGSLVGQALTSSLAWARRRWNARHHVNHQGRFRRGAYGGGRLE